MFMKANLKKAFFMGMEELDIIMDRYFKEHLLMGKNIWDGIHILMVVIMMECLNKMFQMEQVNFIGQMA